jgi:hypothetical protein
MTSPTDGKPEQAVLFTLFPATTHARLIVRYPFQTDSALAMQFAEAADRLAQSFLGRPIDDAILLPWLYLYRHAIELSLKSSIKYAAGLRRNNGEQDLKLDPGAVADRLKRKHAHSLGALVNELNEHLGALELSKIPRATMKLLTVLGMADPSGEAFRYVGNLPVTQDHIDFPRLTAAMKEAYGIASSALDLLDHYGQLQTEWLDEMHQIEADMRADFEADMQAEYGDYQ